MIRVTETMQKSWEKDRSKRSTGKHEESHKIITIWFLFIPIFRMKKLVSYSL